ncbi:MAG: amino acid permease [Candidatus Kapabacteria bacterium]|nr:amino acid permease [Candidatus Kapabacteria bacterium]MDW8225611.1 amino acid permease [Bacteroidota bacterium]
MRTTKSVDELIREAQQTQELRRVLGPANLVALGIGAIIGAGIFVLTGQAAAQYAGPAIALSFVISGIGCVFAALCYAEFASLIPIAGSAYTYAYATLGQFFAWIIGWDLLLEYLFGASTVAVGWSGYVVSWLADLGIHIPKEWASAPLAYDPKTHQWTPTGANFNVPAALIITVLTALLVLGIRESATFNNLIVFVKVGVILLFIVFGAAYVNAAHWTPFIPENTGQFGYYGWSGVLRGAGVIFFAYIGFDAVSTAAQEARNPQKDMPIGIIGSLGISTLLYILVALVLTGVVHYSQLGVPDPMAVAVNAMQSASGEPLYWLRHAVKLGAIAGLSSVILVLLLGQPRILYTMAKDGLLPPFFSHVHERFRTPARATLLTGTTAALIAGLFPIGILGELVSIGTLLAFAIVCIAVIVLRYKRPDLPRPFRVPLMPVIPALGALVALIQMLSLPLDTWIRLLGWMALGLLIYFLYGRRASTLAQNQAS